MKISPAKRQGLFEAINEPVMRLRISEEISAQHRLEGSSFGSTDIRFYFSGAEGKETCLRDERRSNVDFCH